MRAIFIATVLAGCAATAPVNAADPRFEACGGAVETVDATVAFTARDYHAHFPLMARSPELESDEPAFAVVFAEGHGFPGARIGGRPGNQQRPDQPHRTVCIYVGEPPEANMHVYVEVDVALLLP